jgi:hypothetical protein
MIHETIIISTNENGEAHVTPFGVQFEDEIIVISPFKPSKTLNNILSTQTATMNLTDDVRVFAGALTKRQPWQLIKTNHIDGYRLAECLTHVELKLLEVREDDTRPQLRMRQIEKQHHADFKGFNRAQAAVIELAVLTSRLHMLPAEKIQSEREYLQIAIDKTAGKENWKLGFGYPRKLINITKKIQHDAIVNKCKKRGRILRS